MNENHDERGRFASSESYTGARGTMPKVGDKISGRSQGQAVTGVVVAKHQGLGTPPVFEVHGKGYRALVSEGSVNKVARGDKTAVKWAKQSFKTAAAADEASLNSLMVKVSGR